MGLGSLFSLDFRMLATFSCESFALCDIREDASGKVDLFGGTICVGVTLDGLVGGIDVFVGETI